MAAGRWSNTVVSAVVDVALLQQDPTAPHNTTADTDTTTADTADTDTADTADADSGTADTAQPVTARLDGPLRR